MLKFTIAITVWKRPEMLPHAIQSVLAQTHTHWEIFVFSDGFSRASKRVVEALEGDLPISYRRFLRRPRLRGNHLRRAGLEDGTGSHVIILGHDCLLYPTYLETHAKAIGNDPRAFTMVPVAYWKEYERRQSFPTTTDMAAAGEGEVDLLNMAFPRELSLEVDCFGRSMQRFRHADYLSFAALREVTTPILACKEEHGAHF